MKLRTILIPLVLLLGADSADAQTVYRWKDDNGEVHYGEAVPPEYARNGWERLGPDGRVRESIPPAASPEERAERRAQRQREAELAAQQRSQENRDRLLLATFRSVEDLEGSLDRQLTGMASQRASINTALGLVEARFESLVSRAARYQRRNQAVPPSLEDSVRESRAELQRLRSDLAALNQREAETRARFESDLQRYRELTGNGGGG